MNISKDGVKMTITEALAYFGSVSDITLNGQSIGGETGVTIVSVKWEHPAAGKTWVAPMMYIHHEDSIIRVRPLWRGSNILARKVAPFFGTTPKSEKGVLVFKVVGRHHRVTLD